MSPHGYGWVSLTTDYGTGDGFVAACKGVLARLAPSVRTLDITHDIAPQAIAAGGAVLAQTVPYLPVAVHLVVVDPGVGTGRRGVVITTDNGLLVGPDNGVLMDAAGILGGAREAVDLTDARWWLPHVSPTFHGRDVFAPVAAALAQGTDPGEMGTPLSVDDLVRPATSESAVDETGVHSDILTIDHFGNLQLTVDAHRAPWTPGQRLRVHAGTTSMPATFARTFGDAAEQACLVLGDSAGHLAVAVNGGSAAHTLAAHDGQTLHIHGDESPGSPPE